MKLPVIPAFLALAISLTACGGGTSNTSNNSSEQNNNSKAASNTSKSSSDNSTTNGWQTYTAKDGSYTLQFPGQPNEQSRSVNSPLGKITFVQVAYEDKTNRRAFFATNTKYPVKPSQFNVEKGLDTSVDGAIKSSNSKLTSVKKIEYKGLPGREFTMAGEKGIVGKARIIMDPQGPMMFQTLVVAEKSEKLAEPATQAFLDSFVPNSSGKQAKN